MVAPPVLAAAVRRRSRMANTRSMPMLTPTAGTSLPLNMPTRPSYLGKRQDNFFYCMYAMCSLVLLGHIPVSEDR